MKPHRLLVTGASGFVGTAIQNVLASQQAEILRVWSDVLLLASPRRRNTRARLITPLSQNFRWLHIDLRDQSSWLDLLQQQGREAQLQVLHLAALAEPSVCQQEPEQSYLLNVAVVKTLVDYAQAASVKVLFTSSEQVFDGRQFAHADQIYRVGDAPNPLNVYGEHKLSAEQAFSSNPDLFKVVRLPLMYSMDAQAGGFLNNLRDSLLAGQTVSAFTDEIRPPACVDDIAIALVNASLLLAREVDLPPLMHLGGPQAWSRYEIAKALAERLGRPASQVLPQRQLETEFGRLRPGRLVLESEADWRRLSVQPRSLADCLEGITIE